MTRPLLLFSCLLLFTGLKGQSVSHVYKINDLLKRIHQKDTTYVINFWATWCKPCIRELPGFDSLYAETKNANTKIILVSLDFKDDLKKVNAFLLKNSIKAECVLLDEVNGNDYINTISTDWSGAIPATLFKTTQATTLIEHTLRLADLREQLLKLQRPATQAK